MPAARIVPPTGRAIVSIRPEGLSQEVISVTSVTIATKITTSTAAIIARGYRVRMGSCHRRGACRCDAARFRGGRRSLTTAWYFASRPRFFAGGGVTRIVGAAAAADAAVLPAATAGPCARAPDDATVAEDATVGDDATVGADGPDTLVPDDAYVGVDSLSEVATSVCCAGGGELLRIEAIGTARCSMRLSSSRAPACDGSSATASTAERRAASDEPF